VPGDVPLGRDRPVDPIDAAKKAAAQHPSAQSFTYPAGHGFNCDQRGSYHAESAKLARTRTLEFFRKHIG